MSKIVHFHYNVPGNVNIGDEAHVLAIQDALKACVHDIEIINYPISFLCHYQIPPIVPGTRKLPLFLHNMARRLRGVSYRKLIATINEADMVVIGGGGVYMEHLLPFNIPLLEKITAPIVLFGVGYNHNFNEKDFDDHQLQSIVKLGKLAQLQSVRDTHTLNFLTDHGIDATLVGDPAVFLRPSDEMSKAKGDAIHIAINIAAHGWKMQPMYEQILIDAYATMMNNIQSRFPVSFHYFVHYPTELKIVQALEDKGIAFESVVNNDARTTKAHYAAMDIAISMMLHSTILAFGEGVPAICVGYDSKNKSFMELTKQYDRYIAVQDVSSDALIQKVEDLIATLDASTAKVKDELANEHNRYDEFTRRVVHILDK